MILAILQFLRRMSETVDSRPMAAADLAAELAQHGLPPLPKDVLAYEVAGPMFFGPSATSSARCCRRIPTRAC